MDKSHTLAELLIGTDNRRPGNCIGCFFLHRFYQNWKPELFGTADALAARNNDEMGNMDPVIVQDFFRNAFVLAKGKTSRAATSEGQALHLEKRNDVLVEARIVPELFDEVEKNVRSEGFHFLAHKIDVVVNSEVLGHVTDFTERSRDVRLGFPVFRFQFLREILIDGCRTCAVEQNEDFELLFHSRYFVRLNFPVKR